jgi:hypothetical protein
MVEFDVPDLDMTVAAKNLETDMTIKTHVEIMQQLLLGLDAHWSSTESKIKVAWLSMVIKLAGELEKLAQTETQCLESVHGDQAQAYLDKKKKQNNRSSEFNPC